MVTTWRLSGGQMYPDSTGPFIRIEDVARLRAAAIEVCQATEAWRDAVNGLGHPGEPHDRAIHFAEPGPVQIYDEVGDCANCGGAQYGTEDSVQRAMVRLKVAAGHPLQEWEEFQHADVAAEAREKETP